MPVHIDPNRYLDPVQYDLDPVDETNRAWAQAYAELEEALRKADSRDGLALKIRLSEGASGEHDPYADVF